MKVIVASPDEPLWDMATETLCRLFQESSKEKQLGRYFIFVVANFVNLLRHQAITPHKKTILLPGIHALMEEGRDFDWKQITSSLDSAGKAIFKNMLSDFLKNHKYRGKV
jgi:hypothetical protein